VAPGLINNRSELESLLDELATELERLGASTEIVMVGGSWMLWHARRAATRDVDSARHLATEVGEAIKRIGARRGLSADWLNDKASPYWPAGASFEDCDVAFRRASVVVRTPGPDVIFVMKLYRADPQDREDMITLWPLCTFRSPADAARAFRRSYPHAPEDEHLTDYIGEVARDAG
jgi:hypothetical protein